MVESIASVCAIALVLSVVDGKPTTTSHDVARHFGKMHNEVLRRIANLLEQLPADFTERNFALSEYTDTSGRTLPAYRITRDGFMLLAMGFTGKKALQFKLAYIDAFNTMEAQLTQAPAQPMLQPATASQVGAAMAAGWATAGLVQQDIARAVMNGGDDWKHQRYLLSFITDSKHSAPAVVEVLPADAAVLTQKEITTLMANAFANAWRALDKHVASQKTKGVTA